MGFCHLGIFPRLAFCNRGPTLTWAYLLFVRRAQSARALGFSLTFLSVLLSVLNYRHSLAKISKFQKSRFSNAISEIYRFSPTSLADAGGKFTKLREANGAERRLRRGSGSVCFAKLPSRRTRAQIRLSCRPRLHTSCANERPTGSAESLRGRTRAFVRKPVRQPKG